MALPAMGQPAIVTISGTIDQNANDMYPLGDAWAEQVRNVAVATSQTADGSGQKYLALPTIASNPLVTMSAATASIGSDATLTVAGARANGMATAAAMAPVDVIEQADISVVKTASQTTASAGGQVGFNFTVTNPGPSGLEHVVLTDVLPNGFTVNLNNPANQAQCVPPSSLTSISPVAANPSNVAYNTPPGAALAISCLGGTQTQSSNGTLVPSGVS